MYTDFAIFVGLAYSYLPFMILPLYATLERMDLDLVEAAQDLGASRTRAFWDVTWPLARPGVIAGCLLVFIPAMGEYVIPYLLGGPESLLIGRVLFDEFFVNRDWPLASAVAIVLLLLLVVPIVFLQRNQARDAGGQRHEAALALHSVDARVRLRVSLHTAGVRHRVFVQRFATRHGLGRLFDALVRRAAAQRPDPGCGVAEPADRADVSDACDDPRHDGRDSCWHASGASRAEPCSPA